MAESVRHAVMRTHIKRNIAASLATDPFARCASRPLSKLKFAVSGASQLMNESMLWVLKWLQEQFGKGI
jgi:hypothetical protein